MFFAFPTCVFYARQPAKPKTLFPTFRKIVSFFVIRKPTAQTHFVVEFLVNEIVAMLAFGKLYVGAGNPFHNRSFRPHRWVGCDIFGSQPDATHSILLGFDGFRAGNIRRFQSAFLRKIAGLVSRKARERGCCFRTLVVRFRQGELSHDRVKLLGQRSACERQYEAATYSNRLCAGRSTIAW